MDTLSHAIVGVAVAGLSGHPLSFQDPIYLASLLGAQAPDFDIVAQIRGNFSYMKQHRAFSHSIPGLIMWSSIITACFFAALPGVSPGIIFFWSFLGGLSHIIIDFFNAHGAAILWPFSRKRKSFGLLNVFDPLLLILMLSAFAQGLPTREASQLLFSLLGSYIGVRFILKLKTANLLRKHFNNYNVVRVLVLPSLRSIRFWDFVIETADTYYVGKIHLMQQKVTIHTSLARQTLSPAAIGAQKTYLGGFFTAFTPFCYCTEWEDNEKQSKLVRMYDLRYFFKDGFLHSATVVLDRDERPCASYIQTYGQKIKIPC